MWLRKCLLFMVLSIPHRCPVPSSCLSGVCNERGWLSQTSLFASQGMTKRSSSPALICAFHICYSRNLCSDKAVQSEAEERPTANVCEYTMPCLSRGGAGSSYPAIISPPLDWHPGRSTVTRLVTLCPQFSLNSVKGPESSHKS